ncbi:MAG TPA: 3-isopropylmalate dehydratase small subunit [Candidatus Thermoplasmatota archaeon]|nr:3-isopropylmalate dehydratase small subunit [Candidatus Thermoplasmatota archaeon]
MRGPVLRLGNDLNTDVIIPARFMQDWDHLGDHVFEGESPDLPKRAKAAAFVVAGKNFGCGSSREQAVMAIKQAGIRCVIAPTFARIFYRNAINLALPVLEADVSGIEDRDEIEVDLATGRITNLTRGTVVQGRGIPDDVRAIVEDGGLIEHLKKKFGAKGGGS